MVLPEPARERTASADPLLGEDPSAGAVPLLGDRERRILDFERDRLRHVGAKEEAIRLHFGISAARYYQLLNALIDSPAALVHDPMLARRLQRVRDGRMSARAARPGGSPPPDGQRAL